MRYLGIMFFALILLVTACAESQPLPTLVPTNTPEPTATPSPTPLPTPTPLPSVVELTRATDPSQQAFIRVVHAAPNLPTVDVFIERLAIGTNLNFTGFTEPSGIVAGDYFIRVVPQGVRPDAGENLLETPVTFAGGDRVMLVLTGTADNLTLSTFPESMAPLNSGESRVSFLNVVENSSETLTVTQAGSPVVSAVNAGQPTQPVVLPAAETTLNFQLGASTVEYPVQLRERVDYTFILAGTADTPSVIETRNQVSGSVQLRAIHAAAAIGPVDIYVNGERSVPALDYARASDRQAFTAGSFTVDIYPRDADPEEIEPLGSFQVNGNNDDILSLVLVGEQPDLRLITYREDFSPTAPDEARVAFMNTLSNVSRARVSTQVGPLPEVGDLSYGQPPVAVDIPLVNYTVFWNAIENGEVIAQLESASNLQFEPGLSYLYLLTGRGDDQPLIFSDRVGVDEALAETVDDGEGDPGEVTPDVPTRARLINAVTDNVSLDLVINEALLASQVGYAQGSALADVPERDGNAEINVQVSGGDEAVASMVVPLQPGSPYTVIVYGSEEQGIQIAVLPDSNLVLEGGSSHLRLFNATLVGDIRFGLAYSPASAEPTNLAVQPDSETFRRSMTIGMEAVIAVQDVDKINFSPAGIAPAGLYAIHILDTLDDPTTVAASIPAVSLVPGGHYDVIAYQEPDSRVVQAFIVPYETGSD